MARNETKHMESVIALSEALNFSRAAEKTHMSQSAISKNVKHVEKGLGGLLSLRETAKMCA
jgi:DNA-binding transcriptional LysR family regulator